MIYYNALLKEAKKNKELEKKIEEDENQVHVLSQNKDILGASDFDIMRHTKIELKSLNRAFERRLDIEKAILRHQLDYQMA